MDSDDPGVEQFLIDEGIGFRDRRGNFTYEMPLEEIMARDEAAETAAIVAEFRWEERERHRVHLAEADRLSDIEAFKGIEHFPADDDLIFELGNTDADLLADLGEPLDYQDILADADAAAMLA